MRHSIQTLLAFLFVAALCFATPIHAEDFRIHGELYVYDGEFGNPIAVEAFSRSETQAGEREIVEGSQGNFGDASFVVDLANGRLGTFVEASNGSAYTGGVFWAGVAEAFAAFEDRLYFTIPAGVYSSGVSATLRATVDGRVTVSGSLPTLPVTASQTYKILLASPLQRDDLSHQASEKTPASGDYTIEKSMNLTVQLLKGGTILEEPTTVSAYFAAQMAGVARTTRSVEQKALADFYSSLRIVALDVPDGVTWTSASGVFLRDIPSVEQKMSKTWERRDGKH